MKAEGYQFDVAHTSMLKRAQITLNSILQEIGQTDIPIEKTWRLNERHYGGLTGLNKAETAAKYGEAQVFNSFSILHSYCTTIRSTYIRHQYNANQLNYTYHKFYNTV